MYVCTVVIPYCVLIQNHMMDMKTFSKCKALQGSAHIVTPSNHATFTVSCSFNMNSGGENNTEKKRQSKLGNEKKHTENEMAEERDCRRLSTCRQRDAVHEQQGQLKPESAYTVNFSCV